jgi:hypothetical protein
VLGLVLGLVGGFLATAAATAPPSVNPSDVGTASELGLGALIIGVVVFVGGLLAWRGSPVGRFIGIAFGILFAILSAAAVGVPLPSLPASLSVPTAAVVFALLIYVVGVDLFAWRPRR